nr:subunit VI of cytochrome b6/f complex [Klebsormidium crenulatum]YP_010932843.1 subunit VI of cytochrome b6/f complex [Klebsormidium mucosum]WKT06450.1 subunit VI of cytochrome b6/f complex [Klebsormidium crenulatum]WKT07203.1 subunit VI of cytochrome b6/f complex [Klebsormidium mucosum]
MPTLLIYFGLLFAVLGVALLLLLGLSKIQLI